MLKKLLLLLPLAALLNGSAQAQFRYTFKDTTTAYVPLPANAILANGTDIWDDEEYTVPMPFSWILDSTIQLNSLVLSAGLASFLDKSVDSGGVVNGFINAYVDIIDRGALDGTISKSPIRYITTGTAPNRIFKAEMQNVGFYTELDNYNTLNDSASFQCWIYEGSNIVELRYGPSNISYFSDYFGGGGIPTMVTGYLKQIDLGGITGTFYYLSGAPAAPVVKSESFPNFPTDALTSWPANGKVYRFTPKVKPAGIADLTALGNIKVYPNPATNSVAIEGASTGTRATMYSMLGQPVLQTVLAGSQTLDIAALPAGVYKLVLTDENGVSGATTVVKE